MNLQDFSTISLPHKDFWKSLNHLQYKVRKIIVIISLVTAFKWKSIYLIKVLAFITSIIKMIYVIYSKKQK